LTTSPTLRDHQIEAIEAIEKLDATIAARRVEQARREGRIT
jgi:hypothetical protein